jgi:hypothetical protein
VRSRVGIHNRYSLFFVVPDLVEDFVRTTNGVEADWGCAAQAEAVGLMLWGGGLPGCM